MTLSVWGMVLWLGIGMLLVVGSHAQEDPLQQRHAYLEAAGTILTTYMQEQNGWNHYFTTAAPQQSTSEQVKAQETYRHFLDNTLTKWRQVKAIPACYSAHLLYEFALYSYSTAADFHLTVLHAKSALFTQKAVDLADERSRYYTSQGDEYFQRAVLLAQVDGCVNVPPATR